MFFHCSPIQLLLPLTHKFKAKILVLPALYVKGNDHFIGVPGEFKIGFKGRVFSIMQNLLQPSSPGFQLFYQLLHQFVTLRRKETKRQGTRNR